MKAVIDITHDEKKKASDRRSVDKPKQSNPYVNQTFVDQKSRKSLIGSTFGLKKPGTHKPPLKQKNYTNSKASLQDSKKITNSVTTKDDSRSGN